MALEFFKNSQLKKYVLCNKQKLILPKVPGEKKPETGLLGTPGEMSKGLGGGGGLKGLNWVHARVHL